MPFHAWQCECGDAECETGRESGKLINDHEIPIVCYIAVGTVKPCTVDETKLPPFIRRLLSTSSGRIEMHAACAPKVLARLLAETEPGETPETQ